MERNCSEAKTSRHSLPGEFWRTWNPLLFKSLIAMFADKMLMRFILIDRTPWLKYGWVSEVLVEFLVEGTKQAHT
jgi:hypothetical protein